jgi:hypothetical protein
MVTEPDTAAYASAMSSGHWINGVNVANTPTFPPDGRCRECGVGIENIEISMAAAPPLRASTERVDPPKTKGPYYVPCGHDAADAFGGRADG